MGWGWVWRQLHPALPNLPLAREEEKRAGCEARSPGPQEPDRTHIHSASRSECHALLRHRRYRFHRIAPRQAPPGARGLRVVLPGAQPQAAHGRCPARALGCGPGARHPGGGRSDPAAPGGCPGRPGAAARADRPLLPPRRGLRPQGERRGPGDRQRGGHASRRRARPRDRGRLPAPGELDCRRRTVRGRVPRGHVRGGREPRAPLFPHQARIRAHRARGVQAALAHLPAGPRGRRFAHRRDGQDRRTLLLLQADPEAAPAAAAVDARHRAGRRAPEPGAGGLRHRRHGPHRAPARAGRALLPSHRPQPAPGGRPAQYLRACRARARADAACEHPHVRLHPRGRAAGHRADEAGAPHRRADHAGLRIAAGRPAVRQLPDPLRQPRGPARPLPARGSRSRRSRTTPGSCGTTGSGIWTRSCSSIAASRARSRARS